MPDCVVNKIERTHIVDFTKPVRNLRFHAIGVNDTGSAATITVLQSGMAAMTQPLNGMGDLNTPVEVDLSSFMAVTRVEVGTITDGGGLGLDDFSFDFPQ